VAGSLKDWSHATFGSVWKKIRKLEGRLRYIHGERPSEPLLEEERTVERDLCELLEREEIMARERSRVEWLGEGDRKSATPPYFMQGLLPDVENIKLICFYEQMARNVKCNQKLKVWFMFIMRAFFLLKLVLWWMQF
jgi:hypothetical protein